MQENKFEKHVHQKMEEFTLLPKEDVWQKVEARIKEDKHRRSIFFWMLAGLLLTGASGALWFVNSSNLKNSNVSIVTNNNSKGDAGKDTSHHSKQSADITNQNKTLASKKQNQSTAITKKLKRGVARNIGSHVTQRLVLNDEPKAFATTKAKVTKTTKPMSVTEKFSPLNAETKANATRDNTQAGADLPLHKYYKKPEQLKLDSTAQALAFTQKTLHANDNTNSKNGGVVKTSKETLSHTHWRAGFTLYGGVSNNISGVNLFTPKSINSNNYNSQLSSAGGSASIATPLQYKSNASFGVGAFIKKKISKRVDVKMGMDYHYFSAGSQVGYDTSSTRSVYDSATRQRVSISRYFGAGQTTRYVNKYHLLQLPLDVCLRLNSNLSKPTVISFGASPSLLMATNALYLNSNANIYYNDKQEFKTFILFGQTALMFSAFNSTKCRVEAGPALQYNFNSFSKPQTGTNQHLIFAGIKTNIILK